MFNFLKSKPESDTAPPKKQQAASWLSRLNQGLKKTRQHFSSTLSTLVLGKKTIDAEVFEALETILLTADVGVDATKTLLKNLSDKVARKELADPSALMTALNVELTQLLSPYATPITINTKPFVILMVGVNGAGKTTSIAKIAHYYQSQGLSVMLAAGDTFRAAATEQLQVWGERNQVPVIAQRQGADSASVIFDALESAQAKQVDVLIADTAGRLHTQNHLMNELEKIKRVIGKKIPDAPHETMLVLDATQGQNALNQAKEFHNAIGLTGLTLTKLDGTAKGGILFAVSDKMRLPIRFIGVGEHIDDLKPFQASDFVDALFEEPTE